MKKKSFERQILWKMCIFFKINSYICPEAPKKEDMNDLTYIPVNEKTRSRKNGDLMILYNLLPEIAVQAWKHLHPENKEKGENK